MIDAVNKSNNVIMNKLFKLVLIVDKIDYAKTKKHMQTPEKQNTQEAEPSSLDAINMINHQCIRI